jgi:hypothetical protein
LILKLDNIDNQDPGDDYINLRVLGTDRRLEQKFDTLKELWEYASPPKKNWLSIVEAAERDVTALNTEHAFKKLSAEVEKRYDHGIDFIDMFSLDSHSNGPWISLAEKSKQEVLKIEKSKETIKKLNDNMIEKKKEVI